VQRSRSCTPTDHAFQLPLHFDLEAYVRDALRVMRGNPVSVELLFDKTKNKTALPVLDFLEVPEGGSTSRNWWRWGESNPRPRTCQYRCLRACPAIHVSPPSGPAGRDLGSQPSIFRPAGPGPRPSGLSYLSDIRPPPGRRSEADVAAS